MIGALFCFINLVITPHISLELANTAWPKLETCVIWQCFGCQPLGYFHSVGVFLRSEVKRCDHDQFRRIFRCHTLNWINIIVLRTLRRKNYSFGLLRVIHLSNPFIRKDGEASNLTLLLVTRVLENSVYLPIVFFALSVIVNLKLLSFW